MQWSRDAGPFITVPCGNCIGCRLDRSRSWAIRCVHEAQLHDNNCFITLTYAPEHIPENGALEFKHFQDFMKNYRYHHGPVRFFHCGEYGTGSFRPHYHAIIFGHTFSDQELLSETRGQKLYTSASLEKLWPYGHTSVGSVTWQSAAYVARYLIKKVTGSLADAHYERLNLTTGELVQLPREYTTMSRRPGIGNNWFEQFHADVYPDDFCVVDGKKYKPPRYYDNLLLELDPELHDQVKEKRDIYALKHQTDNHSKRLAVREICTLRKVDQLARTLE